MLCFENFTNSTFREKTFFNLSKNLHTCVNRMEIPYIALLWCLPHTLADVNQLPLSQANAERSPVLGTI